MPAAQRSRGPAAVREEGAASRPEPRAPMSVGAARRRGRAVVALKAAVWVAALAPFAWLLRDAFFDGLGADPIEAVTHRTGWWALVLLLATLAVTPARRLTGWNELIRMRRLLGLFAFFYAVLHFGTYLFDQELVLAYIAEDVLERPYITVGFTAFLLLVPLAVTSTQRMIRRLGGRRWRRLHRLVYVAAGLAVLHFLWLVKADTREPLIFGALLLLLLSFRLPWPGRRSG